LLTRVYGTVVVVLYIFQIVGVLLVFNFSRSYSVVVTVMMRNKNNIKCNKGEICFKSSCTVA